MYTCIYRRVYLCIYIDIHRCIFIYRVHEQEAAERESESTNTRHALCIYICTYIYMYTCLYVRVYASVHMCINIDRCMYIESPRT